MLKHRFEDYGMLLLRLALGTMFIAHSLVYMIEFFDPICRSVGSCFD